MIYGKAIGITEEMMPKYFLDTNVLIDFSKRPKVRSDLQRAADDGTDFTIAPPALTELVRGIDKMRRTSDDAERQKATFASDREIFRWINDHGFPILELPKPFMAGLLWTSAGRTSGITPGHYRQLIQTVAESRDYDDLLSRCKVPGSVWQDIGSAHPRHERYLDQEFGGLARLAAQRSGMPLENRLSQLFGSPGGRPRPPLVKRRFSAAIEFLESSLRILAGGAKPRKNDPGLFLDFQLLLYLGDSDLIFVTNEDFSSKIKKSEQISRIARTEDLF